MTFYQINQLIKGNLSITLIMIITSKNPLEQKKFLDHCNWVKDYDNCVLPGQ